MSKRHSRSLTDVYGYLRHLRLHQQQQLAEQPDRSRTAARKPGTLQKGYNSNTSSRTRPSRSQVRGGLHQKPRHESVQKLASLKSLNR